MKSLIAATLAATALASTAHAGDGMTANKLLGMCKSPEAWQQAACTSYVAATLDSYYAFALTAMKSFEDKQSSIGGICRPNNVRTSLQEVVADTERLVAEWRKDADAMGQTTAATVILATIRQKYPCK